MDLSKARLEYSGFGFTVPVLSTIQDVPSSLGRSGDTHPCKVTPVILHGVVPVILHGVVPAILHGVISPEQRPLTFRTHTGRPHLDAEDGACALSSDVFLLYVVCLVIYDSGEVTLQVEVSKGFRHLFVVCPYPALSL